jgi:putative transposase
VKQIITAKLKLETTPEQFTQLRQTQFAYRDALNYVSHYSFDSGKTSSFQRLQRGMYREIRGRFALPSEMTNNVLKQVAATYKSLWTKAKRNAEHRRKKWTKRRFRGLDEPPKYTSPSVTYDYGYDYTFKKGQRVSIRALQKRVVLLYTGYEKHLALIRSGSKIGTGKLWYDRSHKQFYLLVSLELELTDPAPEAQHDILGVDVGARYLATEATLTGKSRFFSGKYVRALADHYSRLQKRLQRKGTRSAKRRMNALRGRERRLKLNTNHIIAKTIVQAHPHTLIGLEELTYIRERTPRRMHRHKGKKSLEISPKERRANRHASHWAFAELQGAIRYKVALSCSVAIKVDADYTSQACPLCGYADRRNRPRRGLLFVCHNPECPYKLRKGHSYMLHADLVGARNIAMRTLLIRQDWMRTGYLSVTPGFQDPDVSDDKAKAARLTRFAELRWSPDTSL